MINADIPYLTEIEIKESIQLAASSQRRRHPVILHQPGDYKNRVFNFMMRDSYMQPHLHPGIEKNEFIHLVTGKIAILFFNNEGSIIKITILEKGVAELIRVPAFTWHTYVVLDDFAVTYETMDGIYNQATWKELAKWAPGEGSSKAKKYIDALRLKCDVAKD